MTRRPVTPDPHAIADLPAAAHLTEADEDIDELTETGPLRRCVVTRNRLPKEQMIRFVVSPERIVVPDLTASLPGRGIWLSALGDVVETARTRGAFARAARSPVTVPLDLVPGLQAALLRRIGDTLGLARRAGQAVAGFSKAREWLISGRAALVVQASDGSPDERARFLGGNAGRIAAVAPLDAATLGTIFGRDHVVHVAVASGRLAERLAVEAARLAGLQQPGPEMATRQKGHRSGAGRDATNSPVGAAGRAERPVMPDETSPVRPDGEQGAGG